MIALTRCNWVFSITYLLYMYIFGRNYYIFKAFVFMYVFSVVSMPKASCFLCHKTWKQEGIHMFHVPKCEVKRKKWSDSCGMELKLGARICGLHFFTEDFLSGPDQQRAKLSREALPMVVESLNTSNVVEFVDASTQTQ